MHKILYIHDWFNVHKLSLACTVTNGSIERQKHNTPFTSSISSTNWAIAARLCAHAVSNVDSSKVMVYVLFVSVNKCYYKKNFNVLKVHLDKKNILHEIHKSYFAVKLGFK